MAEARGNVYSEAVQPGFPPAGDTELIQPDGQDGNIEGGVMYWTVLIYFCFFANLSTK